MPLLFCVPCRWKASIEHGGMKDARKVPHLRASSANVASGHSIANTNNTSQDEDTQEQTQVSILQDTQSLQPPWSWPAA